jgi:transposase
MEAQYGGGVKAAAVFSSVYQMTPCERISEEFGAQYGLPISAGSVCNFKMEAYKRLEPFEQWVKEKLKQEKVLHLDETGINIDGKRRWLHNCSSEKYTLLMAHEKRGKEAPDAMGVVAGSGAILVHDFWKPYFAYSGKTHALCNAHHIRELTAAEESGHAWAKQMKDLLIATNKETDAREGALDAESQNRVRLKYRCILNEGEKECPLPPVKPGQKGRIAKSKARNLLERLRAHEDDALRFMTLVDVPFTNNQAERDLRMAKVQQKVSGCFRSVDGANAFCRIRSYISTCKKNGIDAASALKLLFDGQFPEFMNEAAE